MRSYLFAVIAGGLACVSACNASGGTGPKPVADPNAGIAHESAHVDPVINNGSNASTSEAASGGGIVPAAYTVANPVMEPQLVYDGVLEQGGWIRGQVPTNTKALVLGDTPVTLDDQGYFFAAFDRDAGPQAQLQATLDTGDVLTRTINVAPRDWQIEHVNVARRSGVPSAAFMARRQPELARIHAARQANANSDGWKQNFIWPVKGRISGRFGAQRIYRGEPGSYHTGIDISTGTSGTPFVAPADGVVVLAAQSPFSLEGYLLMIDHGHGLNSAFLHTSKIAVKPGQHVHQGQYIGNIGSTGRATGPHLHWSMKWRDARVDPLLFTGPMQ